MWRAWKRRIATDDNLKRMKMYVVSRCWCCDMRKEETMEHLFLTAPIAEKLWRQFAVFADIHIEDMDMKQIIDTWWTMKSTPKMETLCRAVPAMIMWSLWRRINTIKYGGMVTYNELIWQVQEMVRNLIKVLYPWMRIGKLNWPDISNIWRSYKPRLYHYAVT